MAFSNIYTVSSQSHPCPKGINNCHDLSFYVKEPWQYFVSNVKFVFLSGHHTLSNTHAQQPVLIANMSNATFEGSRTDLPSIINCIGGTYGFKFEYSSNVTISSLVFEGCGPTMYDSTLTVFKGSMWRFISITIRNTNGIGLVLQDTDTFEINNSTFFNNGQGIWNCSTVTYRWGFSVSVSATGIDKVNYMVTDTIFRGNTNASQIGGGLLIYMSKISTVLVTIRGSSTFEGINSCFSSSANITLVVDEYTQKSNVTVLNSMFVNNRHDLLHHHNVTELLNGGALRITIVNHDPQSSTAVQTSCLVTIKNSIFLNNNAWFCAAAAILASSSMSLNVQISNISVIGNMASIKVGGVCISLMGSTQSIKQQYLLKISDSKFLNNVGFASAALKIAFTSIGVYIHDEIVIDNCIFKSNQVNCIGKNSSPRCSSLNSIIAILLNSHDHKIQSNNHLYIHFTKCHIVENEYGPALFIQPSGSIVADLYHVFITISQCSFHGNFNGGIFILMQQSYWFHMVLQHSNFSEHTGDVPLHVECADPSSMVDISDTQLYNNSVSAIFNMNCALRFYGYNVIENNRAIKGAAICIDYMGYVVTMNSTLVLRNNIADYGGALYSLTQMTVKIEQCTFLSLRNAIFSNNTALVSGDNMYGGIARECRIIISEDKSISTHVMTSKWPPYFQCTKTLHGIFQTSTSISSDPYSVFLCDKETYRLSNSTIIHKYPGQGIIDLAVTTTGYCHGFTPGHLNISSPNNKVIQIVQQMRQGITITTNCQSITFQFLLLVENITSPVSILVDIAHSTFSPITQPLTIFLHFYPCPHGMYVGDTKACQCEDKISKYVKQCNITHIPNPLMKSVGQNNWLSYDQNRKCIAIASICPFDYCSLISNTYFDLDNSTDLQCSNNRTGILCGQCKAGLSLVLGSNACKHCSNTNLLLLLVFSVAGIFLIAFIASLNITISNGMLNGLLFYVNIVKLNETQLFPNGSIPVISQFISWLNLDLGIEVCLLNGLDGYWNTWLQFAFPFYMVSYYRNCLLQ